MWRPSLLKLPPVSNRMKVDTKSAPIVYSSAQCTGGSSRHAVACLALCGAAAHQSDQSPQGCEPMSPVVLDYPAARRSGGFPATGPLYDALTSQ